MIFWILSNRTFFDGLSVGYYGPLRDKGVVETCERLVGSQIIMLENGLIVLCWKLLGYLIGLRGEVLILLLLGPSLFCFCKDKLGKRLRDERRNIVLVHVSIEDYSILYYINQSITKQFSSPPSILLILLLN